MKLTHYGRRQWLTILIVSALLIAGFIAVKWWIAVGVVAAVTLALLSFFRDPHRHVPTQRGIMVSPADGHVSSIHQVEHYEAFGEPALCIRIFLSVLDVHVNRAPCHCRVGPMTHTPGQYLNAMKPESAAVNESNLIILLHPAKGRPIAALRQVAGMIARRIVCAVEEGDILQRGQRFGMIKFGSTAELYLPASAGAKVLVELGQKVAGGRTVLVELASAGESAGDSAADG